MVEKARIAALLYNIVLITIDDEMIKISYTKGDEHVLLRNSLKKVIAIFCEAELWDIVDMLNGIIGENTSSENRVLMSKDIINGSYMLNLADIFSTLIEERRTRQRMTCREALEEIKNNSLQFKVYNPIIDIIEDLIEDFEARINNCCTDMDKCYQKVVSRYKHIKAMM